MCVLRPLEPAAQLPSGFRLRRRATHRGAGSPPWALHSFVACPRPELITFLCIDGQTCQYSIFPMHGTGTTGVLHSGSARTGRPTSYSMLVDTDSSLSTALGHKAAAAGARSAPEDFRTTLLFVANLPATRQASCFAITGPLGEQCPLQRSKVFPPWMRATSGPAFSSAF